LAVPSIRSTTVRLSVGSLSANAAEPEITKIGNSSQTTPRICRWNGIVYFEPCGKYTTN
jgi:hypothetical protein